MTTMTIHVEDAFAEALRAHARNVGTSMNKAIKDLLGPMLGIHETGSSAENNPFMEFCGIISDNEAERLNAAVAEQRKIDEEMWK